MNNLADIRFAEMLTTKFCHDIAGPVGAVNNGVEFLADPDPEMQSQAIKLIANSSSEAMVRLQFYRQAYGVNTSDSSVNLRETRKLANDFFAQAKPNLVWTESSIDNLHVNITSLQKKVLLNLLIVGIACLPRGGDIRVTLDDKFLNVTGNGEAIKFLDIDREFLQGKKSVEDIDSRTVHIFYTNSLIALTGKPFNLAQAEKEINFQLTL